MGKLDDLGHCHMMILKQNKHFVRLVTFNPMLNSLDI